MSGAKFTPGPWEFVDDFMGTRVVADGHGLSAPYRLDPGSGRCERQDADNRLIAAAPELLAALAKAAQAIGLLVPTGEGHYHGVIAEACELLERVGGEGFATACAEDPSVADPGGAIAKARGQ